MTYNIMLNIKQPDVEKTNVAVTQGDYGQIRFDVRVKDNEQYITDATSAEMVFKLKNGYIVTGNMTKNEGTYSYIFKGNELQCAGDVIATVVLKYSNGRVSSCSFSFLVRYNPLYDKNINAGPYIEELEMIKQQAQGQVDYLNSLIEQLQKEVTSTVLTQSNLVNNFTTTSMGFALDARAGKTLKDQLNQLNSNFMLEGIQNITAEHYNNKNILWLKKTQSEGSRIVFSDTGASYDKFVGDTTTEQYRLITNSDLQDRIYETPIQRRFFSTQNELDAFLNNHCNLNNYYRHCFHCNTEEIQPFGGGAFIVEGYKLSNHGWQRVTGYWGKSWYRKQNNGTWSSWEQYILTSDTEQGAVSIICAAGETKQLQISYQKTHSGYPHLSVNTGSPANINYSVGNVTNTGFTVCLYSKVAATYTIYWIAI